MPNAYPPNVTVDIYRHYDPAHVPPPADNPLFRGVPAHLRHHVKNGRFGFQTRNLYWTHVLHLALGTDLRSAYNAQLDPAYNPERADLVYVKDYPLAGWCTPFYVVLVTRRDRGQPGEHLMCYLDRFQPARPCFPAASPCASCLNCLQAGQATPAFLTFTVDAGFGDGVVFLDGLTRASRWNGRWTLANTAACTWTYTGNDFRFVLTPSQLLLYDSAPTGGCQVAYAIQGVFNCAGDNVYANPVWQTGGLCGPAPGASSYPAAIHVRPLQGSPLCGCCPGDGVTNQTLHATITAVDGPACNCLLGATWQLNWNLTNQRWESASQTVCGGGGVKYLDLYLQCAGQGTDPSFYHLGTCLQSPCCGGGYVAAQPGGTCSPMNLQFILTTNDPFTGGCCGDGQLHHYTVTVTQ